MGKINLKRTLNSENCKKVAEQKSLGSCEKIVEPKVTMYDLDGLLDTSKDNHHVVISDNMKAKWDEILSVFDTPDETVDNPPMVAETPVQKEQHIKQSRSDYHKDWAKDKAQISFRIAVDLKEQIDQHIKNRKEPLSRFVIRSIEEQIKRDNAE